MSSLPRLDHVLLVVRDAQPTLSFLTKVVGLRIGPRPPFRFPGWWLYSGEQAVVHVALRDNSGELAEQVGARNDSGHAGLIDHIAFRVAEAQTIRQRLDDEGWLFHEADVPATGERQFFIAVPEGPTVELVTAAR
ncbi:VOC family protein [Roseateles violae]|uniref:VOC family protein n=1 Tax=Roseateles violae TaxID=3058042 RepID=A0ABT8DVI8_9BURK|nr:VOC family protein [Pelomonas sp. PFR6]MDN3922163.1 VOC family protein [Pelomonas sp. PFR6]